MALDSFQRLLDFRLPKTKNIVFRHDHKEPKHERSQLKFPPFCLLLALVLWNVATERTRYPAVWWEICLSPATKDSCFSKCYMRIGQLIMTRRTGHNPPHSDLCLFCLFSGLLSSYFQWSSNDSTLTAWMTANLSHGMTEWTDHSGKSLSDSHVCLRLLMFQFRRHFLPDKLSMSTVLLTLCNYKFSR